MPARRLQSLSVLLTLFAGVSSAAALFGQIGAASGRCESQLDLVTQQVTRTSGEARADVWENLRLLRSACDAAGVDPVLSARAALVYLALPEFNTPERELTVLGEKESRLRRIEGAEAVLISLLDRVSGQLFLARRYRDAQLKFEEALQLRAAHYGAGSFEEAVGLLHMSQFYGGLAREKGGERGDVELSIT